MPLAQRPPGILYVYSSLFLYQNRVPHETLLLTARSVSILLGVLLGFFIYRISSKLYGERAGVFSLWLFAFTPELIAHGSLVTTDMGGVVMAVGFLYAALLYLENPTLTRTLACGAALGLALGSKHTNLMLPLIFAAVVAIKRKNWSAVPEIAKVGFISWFTLCALYGFDRIFMIHSFETPSLFMYFPLPDPFLRGILFGDYHNARGHASFFMGNYSGGGWKLYFPTAFLLKTPVLLIVSIITTLLLALSKPKILKFEELIIGLPLAALLAFSVNSKINIGLRHILLAYPLLIIFTGRLAQERFLEGSKGLKVLAATIVLLGFETLSAAPNYLSFFNRAAGGPKAGVKYLSDSNIDWGQDLKGLGKFLKKEGDCEVLLSYFGSAVPLAYGIRYQALPTVWEWPKSEHINSPNPKKEFCAVSVSNLQGTYFGDHAYYAWLLEREPYKIIGDSIYVYDVTGDRKKVFRKP